MSNKYIEGFRLIAVIKDFIPKETVLGFRVIDNNTFDILDVSLDNMLNILSSDKKESILGLDRDQTKLLLSQCFLSTKVTAKIIFPDRFYLPFSSLHDTIFNILDETRQINENTKRTADNTDGLIDKLDTGFKELKSELTEIKKNTKDTSGR